MPSDATRDRPSDRCGAAAATSVPVAADRPGARFSALSRRQTSRIAISANAIGSTSCATHAGMPAPIVVPASRSISDHLPAAPREDGAAHGAERGGEDVGGAAPRAGGNERAGGERQQLAVARRDRRAEKANPQREMLNDRTGAGDADGRTRAATTISASGSTTITSSASDAMRLRSARQSSESSGQSQVVGRGGLDDRLIARCPRLMCFLLLRNSSRALTARSKMSGGTISPRIVFARLSSCVLPLGADRPWSRSDRAWS